MNDERDLTGALKLEARRLGFQLAGVCPAIEPAGFSRFQKWLARGYAGEMKYLEKRQDAYQHPRHVLEGVRSILMLGMNYTTEAPARAEMGEGRVSRYAWGAADYHDILRDRLRKLKQTLLEWEPEARVRGVVDTAPLLERDFGVLAGLGWIGKNTLLLNRQWGSQFFLAALLTDRQLGYDESHSTRHCGTCRACIDACPTEAFPEPYVLDARRCLSYLTIELRTDVPNDLRSRTGGWTFGCDVCQDVCPWNRQLTPSAEPGFQPCEDLNPLDLRRLFDLSDEQFHIRFRGSPLWRSKRSGLLRNAANVLGSQCDLQATNALGRGLKDEDPTVRAACAWALGQIRDRSSATLLRNAIDTETNIHVRNELHAALARVNA